MHWIGYTAIWCLIAGVQLCGGFHAQRRVSIALSSRLHMSSKYLGNDPVFVAGGSSGLGLEVVRKLSALGTPVRILVRREASREFLQKLPGVTVLMGDALDESAVQNAMTGCVSAITMLGGKPSDPQTVRVDYEGNSNVIEQAGILGVERIILVTSIGCGESKNALPPPIYQVLEKVVTAKNKAERDLKMYTNLDWTIIRPGGLKSGKPTGRVILTEDAFARGFVDRVDAADSIVQVLGTSQFYTRKEFTLVDPTFMPNYAYKPFEL